MKTFLDFFFSSFMSLTLKDIVSNAAIVTTVGMNCTGLPICRKIFQKGSTGEISAFPFIAGAYCTGIWLFYGRFIDDNTLIFVNTIGLFLQSCYVMLYYRYCLNKNTLHKQLMGTMALLVLLIMYTVHLGDDKPKITRSLGLCACAGSIIFCASPLAQLTSVIKTKSTENLPFLLLFVTFICTGLWTLYGYLIEDIFVKVPNFLGMVIAAVQLTLFIIYPRKKV